MKEWQHFRLQRNCLIAILGFRNYMHSINENSTLKSLRLLFVGLFLATSILTQAQDLELSVTGNNYESNGAELAVKTRTIDGTVQIRWAPTNPLFFRLANRKGYRLERKNFETNAWEILLDRGPYSVEEFKAKLDTTDAHVASAAQAVHGKQQAQLLGVNPLAEAQAIREEQEMRFAFALLSADYSAEAAEGLALRYDDADVEIGQNYLYRVYVNNPNDPEFPSDTSTFLVKTADTYQAQKVTKLFAESKSQQVILKWSKHENEHYFSGYFIEKSFDGGATFQRLNEIPVITSDHEVFEEFNNFHIYSDKDVINGTPYQYRVIGVTPFGDEGLPSDVIIASGQDLSGPMPPFNLSAEDIGDNTVEIKWNAEVASTDHGGFIIARSTNAMGPFFNIQAAPLPTTTRSFIDKEATPLKANYYIVYSVDDKGNRNGSPVQMAVWHDSEPPAQPGALAGYVDTTGYVSLVWNWGDEPDLLGYRVYRSHAPDREFYQLTDKPVKGSIYVDSINMQTLTEKVYYKVVAVDFNLNPSIPSEIAELKRPDIIPPATPLLSGYKSFADSIRINWQPSPSEDVAAYRLLRKAKGEADYQLVATFTDLEITSYMDKGLGKGKTYEYSIKAVDDANLESEPANPLEITTLKGIKRTAIKNLTGRVDESTGTFQLDWTYAEPGDYKFQIYRDTDDKGWKLVATLNQDQTTYNDRNLYLTDNGFMYAVKVVFADGGESPLSNRIKVNFKK